MNTVAMILVANAAILASMAGPTLPDDFSTQGESVLVAATPSIRFTATSSGIVKTSVKAKTKWIVSESWCPSCPAAKARFLAAGGIDDNVITIAEAKRRHGKKILSVPFEYETEETVTYSQPATYRFASSMTWQLDGVRQPSKATILHHLRRAGPHQGKQWQAWHIESWNVQQLYALHDDDHTGKVPTFEGNHVIEAIVKNADLSPGAIAAALAMHLTRSTAQDRGVDPDGRSWFRLGGEFGNAKYYDDEGQDQTAQDAFGSLFDITVDTPDSARVWIADLLSKQSVEFPSAGVSASWKGSDRTITVTPGAVRISPGVTVKVQKFGVSVTTTLNGATFAPDLSWVTLELVNAPDLTVRFQ